MLPEVGYFDDFHAQAGRSDLLRNRIDPRLHGYCDGGTPCAKRVAKEGLLHRAAVSMTGTLDDGITGVVQSVEEDKAASPKKKCPRHRRRTFLSVRPTNTSKRSK
jgi:hypothetical protein